MKYPAGGADGDNDGATIPGAGKRTTEVSMVGRLKGKTGVGGHKDVCHTSNRDVAAGKPLPSKRPLHAGRKR